VVTATTPDPWCTWVIHTAEEINGEKCSVTVEEVCIICRCLRGDVHCKNFRLFNFLVLLFVLEVFSYVHLLGLIY
jgi:hypothetical protein